MTQPAQRADIIPLPATYLKKGVSPAYEIYIPSGPDEVRRLGLYDALEEHITVQIMEAFHLADHSTPVAVS